jgi:hypothetical protein
MQANPKPRPPRDVEEIQKAILALVFAGFPVLRTMPELNREMGDEEIVGQAVSGLEDYGLIERRGASLMPTPAALHCHRLDSW